MEIRKNGGDVAKLRAEESLQSQVADQSAKIDYIAMMSDVDFPESESDVAGTESEVQ